MVSQGETEEVFLPCLAEFSAPNRICLLVSRMKPFPSHSTVQPFGLEIQYILYPVILPLVAVFSLVTPGKRTDIFSAFAAFQAPSYICYIHHGERYQVKKAVSFQTLNISPSISEIMPHHEKNGSHAQ